MRQTLNRKSLLKKPKELTKNEIWSHLEEKITLSFLDRAELTANQKNTLLHPLKELFLNALGLDINIDEGSADLNNLNRFVISTETYNSDDSLFVKYNFLDAAFVKKSLEIRALFERIDEKILNSSNTQELITSFGKRLSEEISKKTFKFPKEKQFYFFKYRKNFLERALPNEGLLFDRGYLNQAIKPSLDYFAHANGEFKFYEKWHQFSQMHNDFFKNGLTFQTNLFLPLKEIYINTVSLLFTEVENSLDNIDNLLISKETSSDPQKKDRFIKEFLTRKAQNISDQIEQFDLSQYNTPKDYKKLNDLFDLYKDFLTNNLREKLSTILPENLESYSNYRVFFLSQIRVNQQEIKPKFDELKMDLLQIFQELYSQTSLLKDNISTQNSSDSLSPDEDQSLLSLDNFVRAEGAEDLESFSFQVPNLQLSRLSGEQKPDTPKVLYPATPRFMSPSDGLAASVENEAAVLNRKELTQTLKQNKDEILLQQQIPTAEKSDTLMSREDEIPKIKTELSETQNQPEQTSQESTELLRASQWLDFGTSQSDDRLLEQVEHRNWLPPENFDNEAHRQKLIEELPEKKQNLIQENAKLLSLRISKVKFSSVMDLLHSYQDQIIGPDNKLPTLSQVEELMNSLHIKDAELAKQREIILELQTRLSENKDPQDELQNSKQIIEDLNKQNRSLQELLDRQKIVIAESSERALPREAADQGKLKIELEHSKELVSNAQMIARQLEDYKELDQKLQDERQVSQEKIRELEQQLSDMSQQNSVLLVRLESLILQHERFISDTELQYNKIGIENQQLQQENVRLQQQFETEHQDLQQENVRLQQQFETEHQSNKDLQQENDRLKKQLQDERQVSQSKDVRIKELEQQRENLQEKLKESQSREHLFFQENLELRQQIEKITTEQQESARLYQEEKDLRVMNLNKRLNDVHQEYQNLQKENDRLQRQFRFETQVYFTKIQESEQQQQRQQNFIQNLQQENERSQQQMQEERKATEEKIEELKREVSKFQPLLTESGEDLCTIQRDLLLQSALFDKKAQESLEDSKHSSQMEEIIISLSEGMELLNKALASALERINEPSFPPNQRLRGDIANGNSNYFPSGTERAIQISSSPAGPILIQELHQSLVDGNANGNSGLSQVMSSIFRPSSPMETPSIFANIEGSRRDSNDCDDSINGIALFNGENGQGAELSPRSSVSRSSQVDNAESLDGKTASRGFFSSGLARVSNMFYKS